MAENLPAGPEVPFRPGPALFRQGPGDYSGRCLMRKMSGFGMAFPAIFVGIPGSSIRGVRITNGIAHCDGI